MTEENAVEVDAEDIKTENETQPAENKPAKKTTSKKRTSPKKNVREKLTDDIFNEITNRNIDEGIPIRDLCEEYNIGYSSYNIKKNKMKNQDLPSNLQKQSPKAKATTKPRGSLEQVKIEDLVAQLNLLKEMHIDLLLKYNQLLRQK